MKCRWNGILSQSRVFVQVYMYTHKKQELETIQMGSITTGAREAFDCRHSRCFFSAFRRSLHGTKWSLHKRRFYYSFASTCMVSLMSLSPVAMKRLSLIIRVPIQLIFFFASPVTAQSAPGSECGKQHNMTKRQKIQSTLTRIEPFNLIKM